MTLSDITGGIKSLIIYFELEQMKHYTGLILLLKALSVAAQTAKRQFLGPLCKEQSPCEDCSLGWLLLQRAQEVQNLLLLSCVQFLELLNDFICF